MRSNHKVAVIIPSTVNVSEAASSEEVAKWIKATKVKLANLFGGFTSYSAVGGWVSPTHGLVEEDVTIVSSFTDETGLKRLPEVKAFAAELAAGMGQEAVGVEVDHALHFVPPLAAAAVAA
jgi:prepilin signal peptidase PulO-like enzyme (type II secretory pathway)